MKKLPQFKIDRRPQAAPKSVNPKLDMRGPTTPKGITALEIGTGPWTLQGQPASRPEYLTGRALDRLGWHYAFQSSFMGGRSIPGGQVLDFVIDDRQTVVDVRGYYHYGAAAEYRDAIKKAMVELAGYREVVIWEEYVDQPNWLQNHLIQEVGVRGR